MDSHICSYVEVWKTFFYLNICHFKTIHHTAFLSFCFFDFINKIENFHFIYIELYFPLM